MASTQTAGAHEAAQPLYALIMAKLEPDLVASAERKEDVWKKREGEEEDAYAARISRYHTALDVMGSILERLSRSEEVASAKAELTLQKKHLAQEDEDALSSLEEELST